MPTTPGPARSVLAAHPLAALPPTATGGAVAVGNFDGVHRGHQALLARTMADARALGTRAVVLTFEPNPRTFLRPAEPVFRLTPPPVRARLLTALGLDELVVAAFDRSIATLSAEAFIETALVDGLQARAVTVGDDFRFGKRRAGGAEDLVAAGARFGFAVDVVAPVVDAGGERFSSSMIREALADGDIASANGWLGYRWFVEGTVISGDKRGRELGFPTANIRLAADCRLRHGIYAVTLRPEGGADLPGVASYGRRPQFDNGAPLLEVYVFDFDGDLYGQEVLVTFRDWIRPEMRFPTVDDLVARMDADLREARARLAAANGGSVLDRALSRLP